MPKPNQHPRGAPSSTGGRFAPAATAEPAETLGEGLRLSQRLIVDAVRTPLTAAPTSDAVAVFWASLLDDATAATFEADSRRAYAWLSRVTEADRARLRSIALEGGPSNAAKQDAIEAAMKVMRPVPSTVDLGENATVRTTSRGAWQVVLGETHANGTMPSELAPGDHYGTPYEQMPRAFQEQVARQLWAAIAARASATDAGVSSMCERDRQGMCLMCECTCHTDGKAAREPVRR